MRALKMACQSRCSIVPIRAIPTPRDQARVADEIVGPSCIRSSKVVTQSAACVHVTPTGRAASFCLVAVASSTTDEDVPPTEVQRSGPNRPSRSALRPSTNRLATDDSSLADILP